MVIAKRKAFLAVELTAREHRFVSGVAEKLGGADEGPDPHELLEAALAACTTITVQMYANRKGWKLDSADVRVRVDTEGEKSHLAREIRLRGDLNPEERARLIEIANKCPIHRLLQSSIVISTAVVKESP